MKTRADIQGLRAVAILLVVLFHADLAFSGGFTGVDVFFVISGFVIAGTLLAEFERNDGLNLAAFFVRRARRILPAPALMLIVVALTGILADPAGTQHMAAMTGITASGLGSNFYLSTLPQGYFDVSTELNPLLHTWMLSVLAQIYIVFPVLMLASWRLGRSRVGRGHRALLVWLFVAVPTAASFVFSFATSHGYIAGGSHYRMFAFYSSPTRFWEFGVGAMLLLSRPLLERIPRWLAIAVGIAGAVGLGVSALFMHQTGFRESSALLPVAAACLLIASGTGGAEGVSRLLSIRPMVWLGGISYSLYLWHWPLIVFARALWPQLGWVAAAAAAVSLLPAWLSYRFIERPVRFGARLGSRSLAAPRPAVALACVCVVLPIAANLGLLQVQKALSASKAMESWKHSERMHAYSHRGCGSWVPLGKRHNPACTLRVRHPRGEIVLLGDSNAGHFADPVVLAGNRDGYDVTLAMPSSCPYLGLRLMRAEGENKLCEQYGPESIDYLVRSRPSLVVLATRTDFYLQNPADGLGPIGGGLTFNTKAKARLWQDALGSVLRRLNRAGVPVLLVHPVPVLPTDPATCAVVRVLLGECASSLPRSQVDKWLRLARRVENAAVRTAPETTVLDFENQLCGKQRCSTSKNGIVLYRDPRHLSVDGALTLTGSFQKQIKLHAVPRRR